MRGSFLTRAAERKFGRTVVRRKSIRFTLPAAGVLALILTLTVYNRDRRFEIFINELDGMTDEVVKVITAHPTSAGVVEAREIINAKKDVLKNKLAQLKSLTAAQAGGEKLTQVEQGLMRNTAKINELFVNELGRRQKELEELRKRAKENKLFDNDPAVKKALQENEQFGKDMVQLLADYDSIIN
ncbi:MAG: hypothetical protein QOJ70_2678 [Acidobacteriota bacterium]|jgi:hypothetical protein|nr:hypothetical protein [Acidobacteriota bacterium]